MPKTATHKQIAKTMSVVAEKYFKASNAKGISESTRVFLTNKWALHRDFACLLAFRDVKALEAIEFEATAWLVSCEAVEKEAGL